MPRCARSGAALSLALLALEAHAQGEAAIAVGIGNFGAGSFFIAAALALLTALLLRSRPIHLGKQYRNWRAEKKILRMLKASGRDLLHDIALPGAYGGTVTIDYALLTKGGIVCILTKHCNGTIFGQPDDPQWMNVDGTERRKFLNPMIENEGRVRALQQIVPGIPVRNLVVFTGDVHFSAVRDKNVIPLDQLNSAIAMFRFGPCQVEDWDASWLSIKSAALDSPRAT